MSRAAVIVPAYNAARTLRACLEGLLAQTAPGLEFIVVDDGSTDATAGLVEEYSERGFRLVKTVHRGASAARNAGVRAATGCETILFTDADCVPAPDWASRLLTRLSGEEAEVAGLKGIYRSSQKSPVARFVQAEFEERYDRFRRRGVEPDFADTYSAAFRREVLLAHPFDETLPGAIVEDAELGWRLRAAGYRFRFAPDAIVYHSHPIGPWHYFRRKFRIGRWRVVIYRQYPGQISSDSHTSQTAKLQMVLLALVLALLGLRLVGRMLGWPGWSLRWAGRGAGLVGIGLQISFGSFVKRLGRVEPGARLVAWPMLNVRTAAYTGGAIVGLIQVVWQKLRGRGKKFNQK